MYHFDYVSKKEAAPYKAGLIELLNKVQDYVRDEFTFQFTFIGSSSRNMITYDPKTNVGFDFDVNITVNDDDENYSAEEIRTILHNAFTRFMTAYGYNKCEQSTRVITVKSVDPWRSRVNHSCDFAVVHDGCDGQQYLWLSACRPSPSAVFVREYAPAERMPVHRSGLAEPAFRGWRGQAPFAAMLSYLSQVYPSENLLQLCDGIRDCR